MLTFWYMYIGCSNISIIRELRYFENAGKKIWHCHPQAVCHRKKCDKIVFHKMCNALTSCWWWKMMWWHCLSQNVQCDSLPVYHRKRSDKTAFHKMCDATHLLSVIGRDDDYDGPPLQNVQFHSLAVGHRKWYHETAFQKMCNVTHKLLVMGKDVMRLPFRKCAMQSLTSCWLA